MKSKKSFKTKLIIVFTISLGVILPVYGFEVTDTMQSTCYDIYGDVINPCPQPGEDYYGQDANYTINPPSYTKLDANGNSLPEDAEDWAMIQDNITGTIWAQFESFGEVSPASPGNRDQCQRLVDSYNGQNFGGYSDWRLPRPHEAATTFGIAAIKGSYWTTATSACEGNSFAWYFHNYQGLKIDQIYENRATCVTMVRNTQQSSSSFVINNDGTVTDTNTNLMWQQISPESAKNWRDALSYCENLTLAGYDDWRLPNIKELESLVDYLICPSLKTDVFSDSESTATFWTSTSTTASPTANYSSIITFSNGECGLENKISLLRVRAVRGPISSTPNIIPVANPQSVTVTEGIAKAITLTGTDSDNDPLTYSILIQPIRGTLTGAAPNLTYISEQDYSGSDSFTFIVSDGKAESSPATVDITVVLGSGCSVIFDIGNDCKKGLEEAIDALQTVAGVK